MLLDIFWFLTTTTSSKFRFDLLMKFCWSYLTFRWTCTNGTTPQLNGRNCCDMERGVTSPGFPIVGVNVQIFWITCNQWFEGTVKRWSTRKRTWIIQYKHLLDTVYEDVPVINWKFWLYRVHVTQELYTDMNTLNITVPVSLNDTQELNGNSYVRLSKVMPAKKW